MLFDDLPDLRLALLVRQLDKLLKDVG